MKRKGNKSNADKDKERLASMVSSSNPETETRCVHDTIVGAFIVYDKNEVSIQLFENVNGEGQKTDMLALRIKDLLFC